MDLFDRKLQEDYANRTAAAAAAQARADEAARYAVAQRVHEQELKKQREWAETELHSQERTHKQEIEQLSRSYEEELAHANNIFQSFENLLNQVPGIASQRRAMEAFNEQARFVIQTGNALLLYVTARYCALREAVIAAFCPDPEFTTQAQKDACTAFFQRFEARFDRYLKERGLFQDGVKELENFGQEYGIDASILVPKEDVVMHRAFERFDNRADTNERRRLSPREAKPINYIKVSERWKTEAPKAEAILERLKNHDIIKVSPEITLNEVNKYYKTRPWEPWYEEVAPGCVRPDWWDSKELDAEQQKMEKDIHAWTIPRLQIMRAITSGLHPSRILVHHLDDPLRPGINTKNMPPFSEELSIRNILPMSFGWDNDKAWIGIVNLHLEQYLWKYDWHSDTWEKNGIKGMHEMHQTLHGNMTMEPESGMTYHDLYNRFRIMARAIYRSSENCFFEHLVCPVLSHCVNPYAFNSDTHKEPDYHTFYEDKKKEFLFLNKQKGLHDYHSPKSGLIDRIFRGDGKKDDAEPSWQEKQWEKGRAEAYADASLAAYAWEHCSVKRVTDFMRKVFGDDITNKYLKEHDINAVLEEYRTENPYWLNSFAVCRYATDEKGAIIFDEQGRPKENPVLQKYLHFEEKEKTIWENTVEESRKEQNIQASSTSTEVPSSPTENTTTDEESVTQTYCPSAG